MEGLSKVVEDSDKVSAVQVEIGVARIAALGSSIYLNREGDKFELCKQEDLIYSNFDYDQELKGGKIPPSFDLSEFNGSLLLLNVSEGVNAIALRRGYFYFNPNSCHDFKMCQPSVARYIRRHGDDIDGLHLPSVPSLTEMGLVTSYCGEELE